MKKRSLKHSESVCINPDCTGQWCAAHIPERFNVQYNGEQEVVSLNLSTDIENGDRDELL